MNKMASKSYSKRKITDNSHRYQEESAENVEFRGKDFALAVASASGDISSHFRLQNEKAWNDDLTTSEESSVDLNNLRMCLDCIPFNALLECPNDIFTTEELKLFNDESESAKHVYRFCQEPNAEAVPKLVDTSVKILNDLRTGYQNSDKEDGNDLDSLLGDKFKIACAIPSNIQATNKVSTKLETAAAAPPDKEQGTGDQLEDWLDSMLTD